MANKRINHKRVVIVGAGLGGLATALLLSTKGYKVTVIEKGDTPGGRLNRVESQGFTFDSGPTFFSMSYTFKSFFESCGLPIPFNYEPLEPLYTINYKQPKQQIHLFRNMESLAAQFADIEPEFEAKMRRYLAHSQRLFEATYHRVVAQNFTSRWHYLRELSQIDPLLFPTLFATYWQHVSHYFDSEQARQMVSLVAFFLGSTPFHTNAVYSLLSYTEFQHDGYYTVRGGMYAIVQGIVKQLKEQGVRLVYNREIVSVLHGSEGRVGSMIDHRGEVWRGDIFVANMDAALFRGQLLHRPAYSPKRLAKMNWSMGMLTLYIGLSCKLPQIEQHNYYLGYDFKGYTQQQFEQMEQPSTPYFYVNALTRSNPQAAPDGAEALLFVVPVPHLGDKPDWSDKELLVSHIIEEFSQNIGLDITPHIVTQLVYTPQEWQQRYNLYQGSALGLAHNLLQVGALRPANVDEHYANLFYVGASTHPGTGLPMVLTSAQLVCERIEQY